MITKEVLDVCPFDLDEPSVVWIAGCNFRQPPTCVRAFCVFPTEKDAWEYRARNTATIIDDNDNPKAKSFEWALKRARETGGSLLVVKIGNGRVIEEYPV
jgi:hypothetical protein